MGHSIGDEESPTTTAGGTIASQTTDLSDGNNNNKMTRSEDENVDSGTKENKSTETGGQDKMVPPGNKNAWDWDTDPENPFNWSASKRWAQVAMCTSFSIVA